MPINVRVKMLSLTASLAAFVIAGLTKDDRCPMERVERRLLVSNSGTVPSSE